MGRCEYVYEYVFMGIYLLFQRIVTLGDRFSSDQIRSDTTNDV